MMGLYSQSNTIKSYLLTQQRSIERKLEEIETEDGIVGGALETIELGVYAWQSHVNDTREAVKRHLLELSKNISGALARLKDGTYGLCERCGEKIEMARLKIMPTTTLCINCK